MSYVMCDMKTSNSIQICWMKFSKNTKIKFDFVKKTYSNLRKFSNLQLDMDEKT